MDLKRNIIINNIICIILFIFSVYCLFCGLEILLPLGIVSFFGAFIISPLFDILCKTTNKKFTVFQKLTLEYILINVVYCFIFISVERGENYIEYFKYIIGIALIFYFIFFILNKNKYDQPIKISLRKRVILIILSVFLINLPIFFIKVKSFNNYDKIIKEYYAYEILESKYFYPNNIYNTDNYEKLYFRNDFKKYLIQDFDIGKKTYVKKNELGDTEGIVIFSKDLLSEQILSKNKKYDLSSFLLNRFLKNNNISSNGEFLQYVNQHKKFNLFNPLNDVFCANYLSSIIGNYNAKSFQKITLENSVDVYLLESYNKYYVIVDYSDYAYEISFINKEKVFSKEYIINFIKSLSIK